MLSHWEAVPLGGVIFRCLRPLDSPATRGFRYSAVVVRKVRKHPQDMGCICEDKLLAGDLDYLDFKRLSREDEAVVLRALQETFISRAWCLRQPCDGRPC